MRALAMIQVVAAVLILLAATKIYAAVPPFFPSNRQDGHALLNNFINNIVRTFADQAVDNQHQFAVLILVPKEINEMINMDFVPANNGQPLVDNTRSMSPLPHQRVNYVYARPELNQTNGNIIQHAEILVVQQLTTLLTKFGHHYPDPMPSAIILYSWNAPCRSCYEHIANSLKLVALPRMLLYSTKGIDSYLPEQERRLQNVAYQENMNSLIHKGIVVVSVGCYVHPHRQNRSLNDDDTCPRSIRTVQQCLLEKTISRPDITACNSPANDHRKVNAELVNQIMKACSQESFSLWCASRYLSNANIVSGACSAVLNDKRFFERINTDLKRCLQEDIVVSNPIDPNNPDQFPGVLEKMSDLSNKYQAFSIPCSDIRREGLFCSHWKPIFLSAGNRLCKSDHPCGYHDQKSYSWCYLESISEWTINWDYCCIDKCSRIFIGTCKAGENQCSLWCYGHLRWNALKGKTCISRSPCISDTDSDSEPDPWCYILESGEEWERCEK